MSYEYEAEVALPPKAVTSLDDMSRTAGVTAQMLTTDDSGILPGAYPVFANDSCPTDIPDVVGDACVSGGVLFLGKGRLGFFDENFLQTRWKYTIAHEAGHLIKDVALGGLPRSTSYSFMNMPPNCPTENQVVVGGATVCADPPGTDALCRCDHVGAMTSNKLHCLQSLEQPGNAQNEGFSQFYGSKIFNNRFEGDCAFVYYKEFLDQTCRSEVCDTWTPAEPSEFDELTRSLPPLAVSCSTPALWRNNHCGVADFGTELDWMVFFWQLHDATGGGEVFAMSDIFGVYSTACGGACSDDEPWADLEAAAINLFGAGSAKADGFTDTGLNTGVDLNASP